MSVPHGKNPVTSPHGTDSGPSDDEILDLVAGGRHLAFDLIVARYGGRTRRYLRQIVGTDASLDDLTQEVFVRIFRGAHLRRRKGTFPVWLYRVARSIAVDHIRRAQADRRVRARVEEELQTAPGRSSTPLDRVQSREFEESFQRALASLPEEFRTPFLLREQERLSYDQIAEVLDTSAKTISTRIHRARRRLRGLLAPFLPAYGGGREAP